MTNDADTLRQRNREIEILTEIARAINLPIGLEQSLGVALAQVSRLLGLHSGWIYLLNEETGLPYLATSKNLPPGLASNPNVMTGDCFCLESFRNGELSSAANINVVACSRLAEIVGRGSAGLRFHSSIPLRTAGRKLGVLNVAASDWRELSHHELRILRTVADLLSIAIERARLSVVGQRLGAIEERSRLAREVHDATAEDLDELVKRLESLEVLIASDAEHDDLREHVVRSTELARASLANARGAAIDLRAAPLEGRTLIEALDELAGRTERESNLEVTFESRGTGRRPSARTELGLYRIAQQALAIVQSRRESHHVRIVLSMSLHRARLTIEDDGKGFDPSGTEGTDQLVAMTERAQRIGGRLEIAMLAGRGTRIVVSTALGSAE